MLFLLCLFLAGAHAQVTLYDECYFKGTGVRYRGGSYRSLDISVASVKVDDSYRAELWTEGNFSGYRLTLTHNVDCLDYSDLWDCPNCCPCPWKGLPKSLRVSHYSTEDKSPPLFETERTLTGIYYGIAIIASMGLQCCLIYIFIRYRRRKMRRAMERRNRNTFDLQRDDVSLEEETTD